MAVNERFPWAVEVLNHKPSDHILEVGCGAGLLAEQIALHLKTGQITAIDRSAAMIKLAVKRNKYYIKKGVSIFHTAEFLKADLNGKQFDKIVAFNVSAFIKSHSKELQLASTLLKHTGCLYLFFQQPYNSNQESVDQHAKALKGSGWKVTGTHLKKMEPYSSFCIIAQPILT